MRISLPSKSKVPPECHSLLEHLASTFPASVNAITPMLEIAGQYSLKLLNEIWSHPMTIPSTIAADTRAVEYYFKLTTADCWHLIDHAAAAAFERTSGQVQEETFVVTTITVLEPQTKCLDYADKLAPIIAKAEKSWTGNIYRTDHAVLPLAKLALHTYAMSCPNALALNLAEVPALLMSARCASPGYAEWLKKHSSQAETLHNLIEMLHHYQAAPVLQRAATLIREAVRH